MVREAHPEPAGAGAPGAIHPGHLDRVGAKEADRGAQCLCHSKEQHSPHVPNWDSLVAVVKSFHHLVVTEAELGLCKHLSAIDSPVLLLLLGTPA